MENVTLHAQLTKLKKARKTLKFWYKVLLGSNLMDDPEHRKEYQSALDKIKSAIKKIKSGS